MRFNKTMCPKFQAAVDLLGKRWTGLVVQALVGGPRRFCELSEHLEVVSERMLSERLKELEAAGVVGREEVEGHATYALTEKGEALGEALAAVGRWADAWMEAPPPRRRKHASEA